MSLCVLGDRPQAPVPVRAPDEEALPALPRPGRHVPLHASLSALPRPPRRSLTPQTFRYLTWKGKRASIQGIELASVADVTHGQGTEVLRRTGKTEKADCYLSLVTADRSLDLCFDDAANRELWETTLKALVKIEAGVRTAANQGSDGAASGPDAPPPPPPTGMGAEGDGEVDD